MIPREPLEEIKRRYEEVTQALSDPEVAADPKRLADLGREHASLRAVVEAIEAYERLLAEQESLRELIRTESDPELVRMARHELEELEKQLPAVEEDLRLRLIPQDEMDRRNAIVEIRAGTGGDEAALFAGDLFRMYNRFAERKGWKLEVLDASPGTVGGFREIIFSLKGPDVYGTMKYESGVHRVQRVPATESQGRIHTSAASVVVLPEAEEVDVEIRPEDLRIDVFRASGPGGQHVNRTESAVRITHIPTGIVVSCQDEKSQHQNKEKALRILRARLYELEQERRRAERDAVRRASIKTGDRSAKIRTYNFPQDRVTDDRLEGDLKNWPLHRIIEGELDELINALRTAEHAERLAQLKA